MTSRYGRYRVWLWHRATGELYTVFNYGVRSFATSCQRHWEYEMGYVTIVEQLPGWTA